MALVAGCTRISVDPDCPANIEVGDTIDLHANAVNEGGIPTFEWRVSPETAGEFGNPDRPDSSFEAAEAGPATIRLWASDGLFVDIAECEVQIGAGGVIVELTFAPASPETGDTVTLTCASIGGIAAEEFTIEQQDGPAVALTPGAAGEATFAPTQNELYTFSCVGAADGEQSEPDTVDITVRSGRPPR